MELSKMKFKDTSSLSKILETINKNNKITSLNISGIILIIMKKKTIWKI
jgi:hypothetical protein